MIFEYRELKERMHQRHHNLRTLAPFLGITPQAFGRYFTERKALPMDYVVILAWVLNIPSDKILETFGKEVTGFARTKKK